MAQKSDEVGDLLDKLQQKGAVVKSESREGAKISQKVIDDLRSNTAQDFYAWVSWSKSF